MVLNHAIDLVEQGRVPDFLTRTGIHAIVRKAKRQQQRRYRSPGSMDTFLDAMAASPLAVGSADANLQHYEVPTEFYRLVLGPRLKYSCSLFERPTDTLATAEEQMLALTARRALLEDGQQILELGCGWGSATLWIAERYPASTITAVSNSATQKAFIEEAAKARSLSNIEVITCDMNDFDIDRTFDRIVSIEMFEHMRNYRVLFERIARWLTDDGLLFFHIFCHKAFPYFYEVESDADWMAKHFFTGGMMPSFDLPLRAQSSLQIDDRWAVSGMHYARTCRAWLEACDRRRTDVIAALAAGDDPLPAEVQYHRWRMFFMACETLFGFDHGNEWFVGHYRFRKPASA